MHKMMARPLTTCSASRCSCRHRTFSILRAANDSVPEVSGTTSLSPESRPSNANPPADSSSNSGPGAPASEDRHSREPWKTLLEMPARAAWRVSAPNPPAALDAARRGLLQRAKGQHNVRLKHLRQVHEAVIQSHKALVLKRHRERLHMVQSKELRKAEARRQAETKPVLYGPEETLASLKFRLYPNFSVVKRVLMETKSLLGRARQARDTDGAGLSWSPRNVIDFGMGFGSASVAALDVFDQVEWIHGVDPSETMREAAQTIIEGYSNEADDRNQPPPRLTIAAHLSTEMSPPSFDMALFTHTATELPHSSSILATAAILWEKLLPNGVFVMIEPGTPDGFSSVRMVRNMLLDCINSGDSDSSGESEMCYIVAPCTHSGPCPMEVYQSGRRKTLPSDANEHDTVDVGDDAVSDDDSETEDEYTETRKGFCSFVQTMPGQTGSSTGEKLSYLVAQKRRNTNIDLHSVYQDLVPTYRQSLDGVDSSTSTLRRILDMESHYLDADEDELGLDVVRADRNRSSFGRIISSPTKKKGHVHISYCCDPGRIDRQVISKSSSKRAPGVYAAARKARWGGFWPTDDKQNSE